MNETSCNITDVLIVGGGPSGLVAALLLAKSGVRSIIVERNAFTDEHPKAHELNARSIEILRDAGINEEKLALEASPIEDASRILFCRTANEEFGRIDLVSDPERKRKYDEHLRQTLPYLNLSQSEFEKILVAHVRKSSLIDLRFTHRWDSYAVVDGGVRSTVSANNAEYKIESRYLLGCDGASSRVRRAAGIEMDGPTEIQSFVNAFFKTDLRDRIATPAKLYWIIHPEYAGTLVAHHMEKRWVYATPVQAPWERPEDFTPEVMRERIQGALGFDVPDLEIASLSTWHMTAQIARRYRHGRVLLVGDAAHRFPPTGGLGMNTGIADAHNLCWKLTMVLPGKAGEALLDTYESERKPVAQKNCEESHGNFDKIFEVIEALGLSREGMGILARIMSAPPIRWMTPGMRRSVRKALTYPAFLLLGRALRLGRRRERVQSAIAAQVNHFDRLGLDIGYIYHTGAVVPDGRALPRPDDEVSGYIPTTAPGARLPHAWVGADPDKKSTHDFLDYTRFSLLTADEHAPTSRAAADLGMNIVDTSDFPRDQYPQDTPLLVRPDGHVAWRGAMTEDEPAEFVSVVCRLLSQADTGVRV